MPLKQVPAMLKRKKGSFWKVIVCPYCFGAPRGIIHHWFNAGPYMGNPNNCRFVRTPCGHDIELVKAAVPCQSVKSVVKKSSADVEFEYFILADGVGRIAGFVNEYDRDTAYDALLECFEDCPLTKEDPLSESMKSVSKKTSVHSVVKNNPRKSARRAVARPPCSARRGRSRQVVKKRSLKTQ